MGSGESEVTTVRVSDLVKGSVASNSYTTWPYTGTNSTFTYYSPSTIYMYQITCPRCGTLNWCQLDQVTTCRNTAHPKNTRKVCGAKLKAVSETVDFEIPVK